jgi:hypothetical protein
MRGSYNLGLSRGLTQRGADGKASAREVSERRQVGDAQSLVNEGSLSPRAKGIDEEF